MAEVPAQTQPQSPPTYKQTSQTTSQPQKKEGNKKKGLSSMTRNVIAAVVSVVLGFFLFPISIIFSVTMNVGDDNPVFSDFTPIFYIPFLLAVVAWLISRNWIITSLVFIVSIPIGIFVINDSL